MKRLFVSFILALIAYLIFACSSEKQRKIIIGIINHASVAEGSIPGFKDKMAEYGYIEGENVTYLYSGAVPEDQLDAEAKKFVDKGVDLILSVTMPASFAAKKVTSQKKIPIVFAPNSNPVGSGLVKSLKKPGGNITGVSFWLQEEKRLEWLKKLAPETKKILLPYMKWDKSPQIAIDKLQSTAEKLNLEIVPYPISSPAKIKNSVNDIGEDIDAVFIPLDALIASNVSVFAEYALTHKLPVSAPQYFGIKSGALFAYGFTQYETGKQGAVLAIRILDGADPGELPVEMAETFFMLNLKTAKAIGLKIPNHIMGKADRIIR